MFEERFQIKYFIVKFEVISITMPCFVYITLQIPENTAKLT